MATNMDRSEHLAEHYANQGFEYLQGGQLVEAERAFKKALSADAEHASANFGMAIGLALRGDYAGAIPYLRKAISSNPNEPLYHALLGEAYSHVNNPAEAAQAYEKAIALSLEDHVVFYNCGSTYAQMGRYEEALKYFQRSIELDASDPQAYNNLGLTYYSLNRYDEAAEAFESALRLDPHLYQANTNLGNIFFDKGDYPQALRYYQRALETGEHEARLHYNIGNVYMKLDRPGEAIEEYKQALQLNPTYVEAHTALERAYYQLAAQQLRTALEIETDQPEISSLLAEIAEKSTSDSASPHTPTKEATQLSSELWNYRPKSYSDLSPRDRLLQDVKSFGLRQMITSAVDQLLEQGHVRKARAIVHEAIANAQRFAQMHPGFLGGMYLPDREPREIEVARVTLGSTTYDTYAVYAKPKGARIRLRIVDEYGGEYLVGETEKIVSEPLTLGEMVDWMIETCELYELFVRNIAGGDIQSALNFFWATSPFYPEFDTMLKQRLQELLPPE